MENGDSALDVQGSWETYFTERTSPYCGYVSNTDQLKHLLNEYEIQTASKFAVLNNSAFYKQEDGIDYEKMKYDVRWEDSQHNASPALPFDCIPFIIVGRKKMECHQGRDREVEKKEKRKMNRTSKVNDHKFPKTRKNIQTSKKKNCPVKIKIRHIIKFPDYQIDEAKAHLKSERYRLSKELKLAISHKKQLKTEHQFYVLLPKEDDHQNHFRGETATTIQSMDDSLKEYLQEMVWEHNISSTSQMKLLLEIFTKELFRVKGEPLPLRTNKRFWPSNKDIRNHIALSIMQQRNSKVDQAVVSDMIDKWRRDFPQDNFYIRLKEESDEVSEIEAEESESFEPELLEILKEYMAGLTKKHWKYLIQQSALKSAGSRNIQNRRALAALETAEEDEADLLSAVKTAVPFHISSTVLVNLLFLLVSDLVAAGKVSIPVDPLEADKEATSAMQDLIECIKEIDSCNTSGKKRQINKEILQKSKKVKFSKDVIERHNMKLTDTLVTDVCPQAGLQNLPGQNLCFANSLLQCLRVTDLHRVLNCHTACNTQCFVCEVSKFIKNGPISAIDVCRKMQGFWTKYKIGQQQDAQECYQKMMEQIQLKCFGAQINFREMPEEQKIFYGVQKSIVTCLNCSYKSENLELFTDLSVSIDKAKTVNEAIRVHFLEEQVQFSCSSCLKDTSALKKMSLQNIPKNVVVHLKRFSGNRRKILKKIDLDFELSFHPFVERNVKIKDKATLFGIIVHGGDYVSSGHYYAFIKFGMNWYQFDDMKVKKIHTVDAIRNCPDQPYILFYRM